MLVSGPCICVYPTTTVLICMEIHFAIALDSFSTPSSALLLFGQHHSQSLPPTTTPRRMRAIRSWEWFIVTLCQLDFLSVSRIVHFFPSISASTACIVLLPTAPSVVARVSLQSATTRRAIYSRPAQKDQRTKCGCTFCVSATQHITMDGWSDDCSGGYIIVEWRISGLGSEEERGQGGGGWAKGSLLFILWPNGISRCIAEALPAITTSCDGELNGNAVWRWSVAAVAVDVAVTVWTALTDRKTGSQTDRQTARVWLDGKRCCCGQQQQRGKKWKILE